MVTEIKNMFIPLLYLYIHLLTIHLNNRYFSYNSKTKYYIINYYIDEIEVYC